MTANVQIHHLSEIVSDRKRVEAKNTRRALFEACRAVADDLGDDLAGYAVIVWGKDGELRSAYEAGQGPIKPALVPTLAGDALNRHVARDMAPPDRKG